MNSIPKGEIIVWFEIRGVFGLYGLWRLHYGQQKNNQRRFTKPNVHPEEKSTIVLEAC